MTRQEAREKRNILKERGYRKMFEKVNPCHPDKLADRIAGALVGPCICKTEESEDSRRGF